MNAKHVDCAASAESMGGLGSAGLHTAIVEDECTGSRSDFDEDILEKDPSQFWEHTLLDTESAQKITLMLKPLKP